jgi:hypothetical protein
MIQPAQMLSESEGQIRRGWADFQTLWRDIEPSWRDSRRQQWEKAVVLATPPILSLTTTAISELREATLHAAAELADPLRG